MKNIHLGSVLIWKVMEMLWLLGTSMVWMIDVLLEVIRADCLKMDVVRLMEDGGRPAMTGVMG